MQGKAITPPEVRPEFTPTPGRRGDWFETFSGVKFWALDPLPSEIHLTDIAHALSHICRWNGHCSTFYSVAQHSMLVASICDPANRKWALLHDASEAYLGDMIAPLKHNTVFAEKFVEAEDWLMRMIAEKYNLPWPMPAEVKHADKVITATERRDLVSFRHPWNRELPGPLARRIIPSGSKKIVRQFTTALQLEGLEWN